MALGAATRTVDNTTNLDAANLNPLDDGLNVFHSPNAGLNFRVTAGKAWLMGVGAPSLFSFAEVTGDQSVNAGATTLVYLDQAGVLTKSDVLTVFPQSSVPLATITSDGSTITAIANQRARVVMPGSIDGRLWRAGRFYANKREAPTTTVTLAADTLYGIPFDVHGDTPIDRIAFEVTTLDAGVSIRIGLYAESVTVRGEPGVRLEDLGVISVATTGIKSIAVSPTRRLGPGRYFVGLISGSVVVAFRAFSASSSAELGWPGGTVDFQAASLETVWRGALAGNDEAAALPDPFPATPTADLSTAYPAAVCRAA